MKSAEFDWKTGKVTFWDLGPIDDQRPLSELRADLKEDLAQVEYPGGVVIDVGWYRGSGGMFAVYVIAERNWEQPRFQKSCGSVAELRALIVEAIAIAAA